MTDEEKKLPYPKGVFFVIANVSLERFSFYGMRAILSLYLHDGLGYDEPSAKMIYHAFAVFLGFIPLIGAAISDSWLGCFRMVLCGYILYLCGHALLPFSAINAQSEFAVLGLVLIILGYGSIRPCIIAFGGDQYTLPQQEVQLAAFFSIIYFAVNATSLIGMFITPIIRTEVHCLGRHTCYSLAFGVTAVMLVIAFVVLVSGRPMYRILKPKGNVLLNILKCICYALCNRKVDNPGNSWLDRSQAIYGAKLVNDIKIVGKVLLMFIPIPFFWALFEQQGSGWTFLAVRMNGDVGLFNILPDQMQMFNPILVLVFIPIFTYGVYPLFAKSHIMNTPLKKMCFGGFLAAISFAISAFVAMIVEETYPVLPGADEAQLRIYDTTSCDYSFSTAHPLIADSRIGGYYLHSAVKITNGVQTVNFTFTSGNAAVTCKKREMQIEMKEKTAYGIYINDIAEGSYEDDIRKSNDGYPLLRTLTSDGATEVTYTHISKGRTVKVGAGDTELKALPNIGNYLVEPIDEKVDFKFGATYTLIINPFQETGIIKTVVVTEPNSVHILWLLPQYIVLTIGEIMLSITCSEFSYSQAPVSMKAVLQASYLLTFAIGNGFIVLIEAMRVSELQSYNFLLYCGLMVVDMLIFMLLAIRYKYVTLEEIQE